MQLVRRVAIGVIAMVLTSSCATTQTVAKRPHRASLPRDTQTSGRPFPAQTDARRYAQLRPWLVPQQTDASCSAAALALIINALRHERGLEPVEETAVAATDASGRWLERVRDGGPGVDLDSLRLFALQALTSLQGPGASASVVDVVHMPDSKASRVAAHDAEGQTAYVLSRSFGPQADAFVIANALQSQLFRGGDPVGHFVVVGAYDEAKGRVLLLDVDNREGLEPFWLSVRALVAAMRGADDVTGETRGLLWIHR